MSSPGIGFNPLAFAAPDLYAKQIGIARRQALGQALLQGGSGDPGRGAFGGLRNAGNALMGALLLKNSDRDMAALYAPPEDGATGQVSNAPQSAPTQPQPKMTGETDPEGNPMFSAPQPQPSMTQQAGLQQSTDPNQQYGSGYGNMGQPSQAQPKARSLPEALSRMVVPIPGLTRQASTQFYLADPKGYYQALAAATSPTPDQKNASAAFGSGSPEALAALQGIVNKGGAIPVSRGMLIMPDGRQIYAPPQAPAGWQYVTGQNGQPLLIQTPGGPQAVAGSNFASNIGKAAGTPATGYDANNMPIASNQAVMSGNGEVAGQLIPSLNTGAVQAVESGGNPGVVSPRGAVGPMQTMPGTLQSPGYGVRPAQNGTPQEQTRVGNDYLGAMMSRYNNPTLAHIAYNMGPDATDRWLAAGGDFSKLPAETQSYLGRIAVAQAVSQRGSGQPLRPELPQGQATFMQGQAKDAATRHDETVAAASESPMRINVLDNIINLSNEGVATGPGQDWQNKVLGYAANSPLLSKVMGGAKDNVARFQELQKFTYQNAIRNWQAAGGTGTDAQMESMAHANPNDHLFPQALQQIAKWGKAAEVALQGKANAQDRFLQQYGNTPQAQIQFESAWRNSFDPKVFQYGLMSPAEKQAFAHSLKTPQAAKAFLAKQQQLQALGALP